MACTLSWHDEVFGADTIQTLIEGIYDARPELARKILRGRILTDTEPTMAEKELVRVAAKRWSLSEGPLPAITLPLLPLGLDAPPELPSGTRLGSVVKSAEEVRALLAYLLSQTRRAAHRSASDRPVAAILLDRERRLLAAELNTNARIRTRHAEMNLILRLGRIAKDAVLYVSLKPCAMCAARIWDSSEDLSGFRVVYFEDDPGKLARNTILMRGSPARTRFLGKTHPLYDLDLQSKADESLVPSNSRQA